MGLSEAGWPASEAERLRARLHGWASAVTGYRKLRSCRISRGRQTMASADEDAAESVGVAAPAWPPALRAKPHRPLGLKMFLSVDEQAAIADAKAAAAERPPPPVAPRRARDTVARKTHAGVGVFVVDGEPPPRAAAKAVLVQPAVDANGNHKPIARPRPVCRNKTFGAWDAKADAARWNDRLDASMARRDGRNIHVTLYSAGGDDVLSVAVEEAPSIRQPDDDEQAHTETPAARSRDVEEAPQQVEGGRLVTRVDPRGRRELWWVSPPPAAAPPPAESDPGAAGLSHDLRSLLSFRRARRPPRRRVVVADESEQKQWPAVLLTFERGVSPGPKSPHSLLAARQARLQVAAV